MEVMAVKVLPEPVAIWTRARGLALARETSRLVMALTWQSRRPVGSSAGRFSQATAEGGACGEGLAEGFRAVEGEDLAGAGLGVALVGEAGEDACGLVEERERLAGILDPFQLRGGVVAGLVLHGGDILAEGFLLGLDDADGLAVDEET